MTRLIPILVAFTCLFCLGSQALAGPAQGTLERIAAKYPDGLPRYMTPEEQQIPIKHPTLQEYLERSPPTGEVYCPPEYAPCAGLFMAWESYTSILSAMTVGITNDSSGAKVWMVVDTASEQSSAYSSLSSAGANMSRVEFIICTTDTVWIRDYGPRFIFEDGNRAIIDHVYNRPRPNDDAFNDFLAALWGVPQYDIPLTHGGGNFHLFANGDAFMTSLILDENPGLTAQQVKDLYAQYQNVDLTIYTGFPSSFDSTRHIDMWFFPVGDNKVIVGQYSSSTGQPYTITENAVADLTSRGYTVYRTPGWSAGGTHYTYTNAVICNNQVFVSKFGGSYTTQDNQALAVFQAALPGKTFTQIDSSGIITAAGAMHCIVMHVPALASDPVVTVNAPNGGETWYVGEQHNVTWTATDDVGVTGVDLYLSTDGGASYPYVIAANEPNDGVFPWTIPNLNSSRCRVKAVAHDGDGHTGEDVSNGEFTITVPPPARELIYSFPLDSNPGWTVQSSWAFGHPTGAGSHNHDPSNGHTGTNVYGYNLSGDYANNLSVKYLTTTAINCTDVTDVQLRFWRWLGVEAYFPGPPSYGDRATIQVSNDGTSWTTVWANGSTNVSDAAWTQQTYDLSAVADDQATVYIRWGMGPTDGGTAFPGWNIDDVEIWALRPPCDLWGDMNDDSTVDGADIQGFVSCYVGGDPEATGCACSDMDDSGILNQTDLQLFVNALLQ
jgi:agmatine/peptidylarginine deiminase